VADLSAAAGKRLDKARKKPAAVARSATVPAPDMPPVSQPAANNTEEPKPQMR
jgi:hypothetical protein